MGVARIFFGGDTFSKKISKIFKIFLKNNAYNALFKQSFSQFNNARGHFFSFGRRTQCEENFGQNFQRFSEENCETCSILADFSENLRNYALIFCGFGRKRYLLEILRKISKMLKIFLKKIAINALF